jgi:hypothetical protein
MAAANFKPVARLFIVSPFSVRRLVAGLAGQAMRIVKCIDHHSICGRRYVSQALYCGAVGSMPPKLANLLGCKALTSE